MSDAISGIRCWVGGKKALGLLLGFPDDEASQQIVAVLTPSGRVGEGIAKKVYDLLASEGVTRSAFLRSKGLPEIDWSIN